MICLQHPPPEKGLSIFFNRGCVMFSWNTQMIHSTTIKQCSCAIYLDGKLVNMYHNIYTDNISVNTFWIWSKSSTLYTGCLTKASKICYSSWKLILLKTDWFSHYFQNSNPRGVKYIIQTGIYLKFTLCVEEKHLLWGVWFASGKSGIHLELGI